MRLVYFRFKAGEKIKRYHSIPILVLSIIIFYTQPALSWFKKADRGRCGAKSLSIEVSPTEGAFSHYYNPAYIPILQQITFSNIIYFEDMYLGSLFYCKNELAFELRYFNFGEFQETQTGSSGETIYLGTWRPFDLIFKMGYSFKGIGLAGKFIYEQIYYKPEGKGWAVCFDVGVKKKIGKLDLTLVGRNIGTQLYFGSGNTEALPLELCQGIRYNLYDILFLSAELREPIDNNPYVFVNGEFTFFLLTARVGYNQNLETLSLGCGIKLLSDLRFDYSVDLFHPLSSTHRFSISLKL